MDTCFAQITLNQNKKELVSSKTIYSLKIYLHL